MRTHLDKTIREQFDNRSYLVPQRAPWETVRLGVLRDELDHPNTRLFTVERKLMGAGGVVRIPVEAISGHEAAVIANEVKYALDWQNGHISHHHAKPPESWAMNWPGIDRVIA